MAEHPLLRPLAAHAGAPAAADGHLRALLKLGREEAPPPPSEHPAVALLRRSPPTTPPPARKALSQSSATPSPPRVARVQSTGSTTASSISDSVNSVSVSTPSVAERSMQKMISNLGPPRSIHHEDSDGSTPKPPKWRSLRSRGAKLYAWATAARLSAEGRGAGVNLGFDPSSPVRTVKKMEKEASETSLELMRLKLMRKAQDGEKAKRERQLALEATTRMLDYLAAGGEEAPGTRLSIDALREIGASDEISSEDRRRTRHHRRGSSAGSTISDADSFGDSFASNSYSEKAHPLFTRSAGKPRRPADSDSSDDDGAGGTLASHLATFKFRRALDAAGGRKDDGNDLKTIIGDTKRPETRLSGAAQRAAAAFAARGGGRKEPRAPPWSPFQEELSIEQVGLQVSDEEVVPKRTHRRQPSQDVSLLVEGPRKARVELWPETEAVLRLHAAIARGDARAVRTAAVEGARGGPVGAFATMARALHVAAARDGAFGAPRAGVVELLVSLGADACAPDAIGATPLHVAAACGNASALAALLRSATCENDDDGAAEQAASRRCHAGLTPLEVSLTRRRDARELFASLLCRARAFDVDFTQGPLRIKLALVRHTIPRSAPAGLFAPAPPTTRPPPPPPPPPLSLRRRPSSQDGERPSALVAMSPARRRHRRTASDGSAPWQDDASRRAARHARRVRAVAFNRGAPVPPPIPEVGRKPHQDGPADDFCGPRAPPARTLLVSSVSSTSQARGLLEPGDQLLALNGLVLAAPDEGGFQQLMGTIKTLARPLRATFVAGSFPHLSVEDDPCVDLLTRFSPPPRPENCDDEPR